MSTRSSTCAAAGPLTGGPSSSSTATASATEATAKLYRRTGLDRRWYDSLAGKLGAPPLALDSFTALARLVIVLYDARREGV
jgi:hypothetical protein